MDLPLSNETTLTEIAAHIKRQFVSSNLEGTLAYLRGPQPGNPVLLNQIARRILHSPQEFDWKDVLRPELRAAPQPMPAEPAKSVINAIEAEIRRLRNEALPPRQQMPGTDFISLGRSLAGRAVGACLYCFDSGEWFRYDDDVWVADKDQHKITQLAEDMLSDLLRIDPDNRDVKAAARAVESIVKRARTNWDISIKRTDLDPCANCINTPGTYFNLETGDTDRNQYLDYCASRTRATPAYTWEDGVWAEFLEALLPDKEDRLALQRMAAYVLLGDRQDKAVFFLYGDTNLGKSLFLNAIEWALGDYCTTTTTDLWLKSAKNDYTLADLPGKRLITCAEFDEDMRINTSLMKRFTGGELIEARSPYGKPFRFKPQGTIVISTNKLPWLGSDGAAWGRMYVMTFNGPVVGDHQFSWEKGNHKPLAEVLKSEEVAGEVLRWMMDGVEDYLDQGINWPETSLQVIKQERADQRHHAEIWIAECTVIREDGGYTSNEALHAEYRQWSRFSEGVHETKIISSTALGKKLRAAGYSPNPSHKDGRGWDVRVLNPKMHVYKEES